MINSQPKHLGALDKYGQNNPDMKTNLGPTSAACSSSWVSSLALGKEPLQAALKRVGRKLPIPAVMCGILRISRFDLLDLKDEILSGRHNSCLLEFSIS